MSGNFYITELYSDCLNICDATLLHDHFTPNHTNKNILYSKHYYGREEYMCDIVTKEKIVYREKTTKINQELADYIVKLHTHIWNHIKRNELTSLYDFTKENGQNYNIEWNIVKAIRFVYDISEHTRIYYDFDIRDIKLFPTREKIEIFIKLVEKYQGVLSCNLSTFPTCVIIGRIYPNGYYDKKERTINIDQSIYDMFDKEMIYEFLRLTSDKIIELREIIAENSSYCNKFTITNLIIEYFRKMDKSILIKSAASVA